MTLFFLLYGYQKWKKNNQSLLAANTYPFDVCKYGLRILHKLLSWAIFCSLCCLGNDTFATTFPNLIFSYEIHRLALPNYSISYTYPNLLYYVNLFSFFQCQPAWRSTLYLLRGNITRHKVTIRYSIFQQFTTA